MTNEERIYDKIEIIRLLRLSNPSPRDIDLIYSYTKKYINKDFKAPTCNGCNLSKVLSDIWINLGNWYSQNKQLFEPIEEAKVIVEEEDFFNTDDVSATAGRLLAVSKTINDKPKTIKKKESTGRVATASSLPAVVKAVTKKK